MTIEPYAFSEAERIRYGGFPVLDTILYRWARKIEETLFDQFRIELYAGCSVVEEMKFSAFFGSLKSARPIYFIELVPLPGHGLFVLDNRFARICLNGDSEQDGGQKLTPENQEQMQHIPSSIAGHARLKKRSSTNSASNYTPAVRSSRK